MKKIICLIALIFTESLFADVVSNRYEDGNIHYGLPSWISLADNLKEIVLDNETPPDNYALSDNRTTFVYDAMNAAADLHAVIDFPVEFTIEIHEKKYSSIVVNRKGVIEFGNGKFDYLDHPYIKLASNLTIDVGESFEWGIFSQKIDDRREDFLVLTFGPFYCHLGYLNETRKYSIQVLIYQDGEIQVQYWNHDNPQTRIDDWMKTSFFDGYRTQISDLKNNSTPYIDIYGVEGLRPGWIAKAMRSEYAVDITEPQKGAGLLVQMKSAGIDFGGIIAYDYSREHPVVGAISSVDVLASNMPTEPISPLYCWYFDEYFTTYYAHYEKWLSNEFVALNLTKNDFEYTWTAYKNNPNGKNIALRTDETIDFISAPAFKFQRVEISNAFLPEYEFYIRQIRYNLAQPNSIQILPHNNKIRLTVENSTGGMVEFTGLSGEIDASNSFIRIYDLYVGTFLTGSILASPGYFINQVSIIREGDESNVFDVYKDDNLLMKNTMGLDFVVSQNKREIRIAGNIAVDSDVILRVSYKKCTDRELAPVIPAMVKTENFTAPQSSQENRIFSSAKILNAFGGVAQEQKKIKDGEYTVSSEYSNRMNQVTRSPMTFVHKSQTGDFEYVDMACEGCIIEANAYYYKRSGQNNSTTMTDDDIDRPDAENNAFTEVRYFNGYSDKNGATTASAGIAKRAFAFNENSYAQEWVFPASSEYDYIPHDKLDNVSLVNSFSKRTQEYNDYNSSNGLNNKGRKHAYVLKIHRDAEGKFSQEIYDGKGQKVTSWFYDGNDEQIIIYEYDAYGNLLKTYNKDYTQISLNTSYDAQGRVESVQSNDRGLSQNRYDSKGRLRFVKTPLHGDGEFAAYFFDKLGRTVAVGEVSGMSSTDFDNPDIDIPQTKIKYVSKTIYGKPPIERLLAFGVKRALAESILDKMKCIRPNDVGAVVAFDDNEKMVSIKLSEYNRIGEKKYQWIVLGLDNVPAVELSYEYNLSSELTSSTFSEWDGTKWNAVTTRTRSYDNQGRLVETKENGKPLAKYIYTPNGNVREKLYYDDDKLVFRKVISRDVYDRPTKIAYYDSEKNGKEMYSATLDFKSVQTNQVKKASHNWHSVKGGENPAKQNTYDYDYSGRLTSVSGDQNASYDFDALGRMVKKKEADTTINYLYSTLFYRPAGMSINDDSPSALGVYIQYDAAGNIWYDLHNKLVYKNGKNNMPSKVFLFSTMPQNITLDEVDALDDVNGSSPYLNDVTERIDIAYDDGGDRLWYSYNKLSDGSGMTRVTLPGVGVYEATKTNGVNGTFKLVRKDLVAGGYRDEAGHARFPVMDAQGNVRGYATSDGIQSAYDYFAYGTVVDLATDAGDDNKRWQDKEFDGEHGKYYFGSRYFDPFFGMWMSPDPAGQFANPYTYGGDPVNFVDPNGEFAFIPVIAAAVVGAVIGGFTSFYSCEKHDGNNCLGAAGRGALIGGVSSAVGGAAGGALAGTSTILSGVAGGAASSTAGYLTDAAVNDRSPDISDLGRNAIYGGSDGFLNSSVNSLLSWNVLLSYATSVRDALSSMVVAKFNGRSVSQAGWKSITSSLLHSRINTRLTNWIGDFGRNADALNKWYNLGPDGKWMTESESAEFMREHKGSVSASVAPFWDLGDAGFWINLVSGAGPFSHVRASDVNGDIAETNRNGVMEYNDNKYQRSGDAHPDRLTYVTTKYSGSVANGMTVNEMKARKMGYWPHMCVGAAHLIVPSYRAAAPNNFNPWAYRNYWGY